jgi:hypothetical protein
LQTLSSRAFGSFSCRDPARAGALFPRATIVPLDDPAEFFNRTDAGVLPTSAGVPLTLRHPFYAVAVLQSPCALAWDRDRTSLMLVSFRLATGERSATLRANDDYRVLGRDPGVRAPRWSVVRDVPHPAG